MHSPPAESEGGVSAASRAPPQALEGPQRQLQAKAHLSRKRISIRIQSDSPFRFHRRTHRHETSDSDSDPDCNGDRRAHPAPGGEAQRPHHFGPAIRVSFSVPWVDCADGCLGTMSRIWFVLGVFGGLGVGVDAVCREILSDPSCLQMSTYVGSCAVGVC